MRNLTWIFPAAGALLVLSLALTRDVRYSREYMGDLRNRVVGARIIEDGGSPYFYKYHRGDTVRYYDPQAFDIYAVSICTSTPFLHRLLIPLADLPFATIMRIWTVVLWMVYLAMAAYALRYARAPKARAAVLLVTAAFLLTNAWELHTKYGQTYLLIPAFAMLVFGLSRKRGLWWSLAAGLAAAALVMIRPNAVLFLIPFLFRKEFRWTWLLPGVVAFVCVLAIPRERGLWGDYEAMLGQQMQIHQDLRPTLQAARADPGIREWEGINRDTARARLTRDPVHIYSENGNIFVLYRKITGHVMPVAMLAILGAVTILLIMALLVRRRRYADLLPAQLAIVGICLYMISDLFSPIYRHAYYGVQWTMPLLLAAALFPGAGRRRDYLLYLWLLFCLTLNIVHLPIIRMANTIGEYGFLIGLLMIGFAHRVENLHRDI